MIKNGYVYIIGNEKPTIYVGVTSDLVKRIYQHKNDVIDGFGSKHNLHKLLYYEFFENIINAIEREKQLKNWHRQWKINLIKSKNPTFKDLYLEII